MHTAEHLLTAVMRKHFGAPRNIELHLNEKKTKCDYEVPNALTDKDVEEVERLVNEQILNGLKVTDFVIDREDASQYDLWKVPKEVSKIRIVKIGDFDAQPCRGAHVSITSDIGTFQIISHEMRENGSTRIRFRVA